VARYTVQFSKRGTRDFKKLAPEVQRRLAGPVQALADEPRPDGAKQLAGDDRLLRIRVGIWRVVYVIEEDYLVVLVVRVGHRRQVYRGL
jgi:mRNA interferase RelE/StbE